MTTIILTGKNTDRLYDKVFNIIDKHSTLFKCNAENEYETKEGYVLEIKSVPCEALAELENVKGITIA